MKKIQNKVLHFNRLFCNKLFCPTHLVRDLIIITVVIVASAFLIITSFYVISIRKKTAQSLPAENSTFSPLPISEEEIFQEVKTVQATIDISAWKNYQNRWYGVELKYPADWEMPSSQGKRPEDSWAARYQFRQKNPSPENLFVGFDLAVYETSKTNLFTTKEFPAKKILPGQVAQNCQNIQGHVIETGDYPAEEIYIGPTDDCYVPTLFFSFTKGDYLYTLSPQFKAGMASSTLDYQVEITNYFPEFFSVASTLAIVDIVRPKPTPATPATVIAPRPAAAPKSNAPFPVSYKKVGGKLVCAKKNDKPHKSATNKKKHMDMECCLDPDEYPNPHCSYDSAKYQKYL